MQACKLGVRQIHQLDRAWHVCSWGSFKAASCDCTGEKGLFTGLLKEELPTWTEQGLHMLERASGWHLPPKIKHLRNPNCSCFYCCSPQPTLRVSKHIRARRCSRAGQKWAGWCWLSVGLAETGGSEWRPSRKTL